MTVQLSPKNEYIELFRKHKFNCFPIAKYIDSELEQKKADKRYQASQTTPNQTINENENYGILPTVNGKNAVIDFDNKEKYRKFAEHMITKGYMVIETPHGWHIPVIGLSGNITKIELFDYTFQKKKIIEIQGSKHFVIGVGSDVFDKDIEKRVTYQNKGSKKIWDAKQKDFHQFIDELCNQCKVESHKKDYRSATKRMRERFLNEEPPTKGTSNDYFFQASKQCNTDGLSQHDATEKIKRIYDKWSISETFSGRPWSNIETKINEVYEKNLVVKEGRPKETETFDRTSIAKTYIDTKKIYSNIETKEIFENNAGFLEKINDTLQRELQFKFPEMEEADYKSVLFKLRGLAEPIPPTNKDLIVFNDGIFSKKAHTTIETEEIADMGFKDYNYLPKSPENEPTEFIKVMFSNVSKLEHPRIKAGLRAILESYLDPRISVIYGLSGVGKSTGLNILVEVLGTQYALTVELTQFLADKFIKAKIIGKRLVVFQDLPMDWKDFSTLKALTGEQTKSERGFMQDMVTFDNKIKIWASGNYLTEIPLFERDAMYKRRLSLVHNIRVEPYKEDPKLAENIIKDEGEKIISWILNLDDEDCEYEKPDIVKKEWEGIASPEVAYMEKYWQPSDDETTISANKVWRDCKEKTGLTMSYTVFLKALKNLGYNNFRGMIQNVEVKEVYVPPKSKDHKIIEDNE